MFSGEGKEIPAEFILILMSQPNYWEVLGNSLE